MNYKKEMTKLLESADERKLNLIWRFIVNLLS